MGELCARFEVDQPDAPGGNGVIYVKSQWFTTKFSLWVTDGLNAWFLDGDEEEVSRKAFSWDCTVADYLESAEKYLSVQDPKSIYSFVSQGDEARKLSWTLVRDGVQLVSNWRVERSSKPKEITCDILDVLMRGSSRLSEELQRKRRSFEQMHAEADRCLAQSMKFKDQKVQFEDDIYIKFVAVLNSKKAKNRELNEQVLRSEVSKGQNAEEADPESEDELDETDKEDNEEGDDASKDETFIEGTEKKADQDSEATEILPADSPMDDISSKDPGLSQSVPHNIDQTEGNLDVPVSKTSSVYQPTETVIDAAMLLSGSTYTSAPRKRRHQ